MDYVGDSLPVRNKSFYANRSMYFVFRSAVRVYPDLNLIRPFYRVDVACLSSLVEFISIRDLLRSRPDLLPKISIICIIMISHNLGKDCH